MWLLVGMSFNFYEDVLYYLQGYYRRGFAPTTLQPVALRRFNSNSIEIVVKQEYLKDKAEFVEVIEDDKGIVLSSDI